MTELEKAVAEFFSANEAYAAIEWDQTKATDRQNEEAADRLCSAEETLLVLGRALVSSPVTPKRDL